VLIRHGLIRPSFVPPPEIRELRNLTRYRARLVQERTREQNRILKVLQTANIKLDNVASDVFGVSGIDMLHALAEATQTPQQIAQLARGLLRKKIDALELALEGTLSVVHREMLKVALQRLDQANAHIGHVEQLIEQRVRPYEDVIELLIEIPGIDRTAAITIIAEIGLDMSVFPSKEHLSSWAGVCPGNNESAGKRRSGKPARGNLHLKTALCQCAQSAVRTKRSYFRDKFYRLKARRGHNRAVMAIARKILEAIYIVLSQGVHFSDLGASYLDQRDKTRVVTRLTQRIEELGYSVTLISNESQEASA
jgi:transposase